MNWKPGRVLVYRQGDTPRTRALMSRQRQIETRGPPRLSVGLWDLGTGAGSLPRLLDAVDECQNYFSFFCVEAPLQTELAYPGTRTAQDWYIRTGHKMDTEAAQTNISARAIFAAAKPVLEMLPVEWLILIVKSMISDTTNRSQCWYNLFSTSSHRLCLVSTYELREYAAEAGRTFEAAVFGVAFSALLAAMVPKIEYQSQSTGSLFDFCENRRDIVKSFRDPSIDPANWARLPNELREPTDRILAALKSYKGHVTRSSKRARGHMMKRHSSATLGTPKSLKETRPSFAHILKNLKRFTRKK